MNLAAGEIVQQNFLPGVPLLGKRLGAVLAQPYAVAVAVRCKTKRCAAIFYGKTCAAQMKCAAHFCARNHLAAHRLRCDIACVIPHGVTKPRGGVGARLQFQRGQHGADLLRAVFHGGLVTVGGKVGGGGHPLQIGQRSLPDILAGLGVPGADAVVTGRRRAAIVGQNAAADRLRRLHKQCVESLVIVAPARF